MSNKQNDIWEENKEELKCMYCGGEGAMCQKCKKKYQESERFNRDFAISDATSKLQ